MLTIQLLSKPWNLVFFVDFYLLKVGAPKLELFSRYLSNFWNLGSLFGKIKKAIYNELDDSWNIFAVVFWSCKPWLEI